MGKELFSRYVWLLETIHRAGKITFEEINARWLRSELSGGETLSLRTFHHHRDAIEAVSYTHLRAHETGRNLVCRLLLEKKKPKKKKPKI